MKLSKLFESRKLTLSFEVFPPKNDTANDEIFKSAEEIADFKPDFMSVTYGAGGTTDKYTSTLAQKIEKEHSVPTIAHQTCVNSSKESVLRSMNTLKESGIENILALRGDIPEGYDYSRFPDFKYASDLVEFIKKNGDFCVGGACYPEGHVESDTITKDIENLRKKVDAGCEFLTTQMFFDNDILYRFLYRIRDVGINVPVVAGIMPVTNVKQIERICKLSGTKPPQRFVAIVDKFGTRPEAMRQAGVAYATEQVIDLYANGVNNVHIYTMNQPWLAEKIKYNLKDII